MKKKILAAILAVLLAFSLVPSKALIACDACEPNIAVTVVVTVDGVPVEFIGQGPVVVDGRILVPVRGVFEQMGFSINWDSEAQAAVLTRSGDEVRIAIGSTTFTTNGVAHALDVPAQLVGDSTMIPLRVVLESVGYSLDWRHEGGTDFVIVSSAP